MSKSDAEIYADTFPTEPAPSTELAGVEQLPSEEQAPCIEALSTKSPGKRKWVAPAMTKHNLKDATMGHSGSCIDPNPGGQCHGTQPGYPDPDRFGDPTWPF